MMKGPISLLAEAAAVDLSVNTETVVRESEIRSTYSAIPEVTEEVCYTAEMVTVVKVGEDYMVEAYSMMPYMRSNDITSFSEALDNIAAANNLPLKSVGLLIESECAVTDMINKAVEEAKATGKTGKKKSTFNAIGKIEDLTKSLTNNNYKVKKKLSKKSKK